LLQPVLEGVEALEDEGLHHRTNVAADEHSDGLAGFESLH